MKAKHYVNYGIYALFLQRFMVNTATGIMQ